MAYDAAVPGHAEARAGALARPRDEANKAWTYGIVALVLVVWLIPIRNYTLPVHLPFNLEVYRLLILVLLFGWAVALANGRGRVTALGHGRPVVIFALAAAASVAANYGALQAASQQTQALKDLSFVLSFLIAFLIVTSNVRRLQDIDAIIMTLVLGGVVVGIAAIYEERTGHNLFEHLNRWLPFLHQLHAGTTVIRSGRLRVFASAQHPIALGCALTLCLPLALYLARRADSKWRSRLWLAAGGIALAGAFSTQSRTVLVMLFGMLVATLWLRRREFVRFLPHIVLAAALIHVASPGSMGSLYKSLNNPSRLYQELQTRPGMSGSGRLADIKPGLRKWKHKPIFGEGVGTQGTLGQTNTSLVATNSAGAPIIFDDQYLNTLVSMGAVGLIALVWLVWAASRKLGLAAKRTTGQVSNLLAACSIAAAGFAASMFTFDAFSFVQVTLLFFVIIALGLSARALSDEPIRT
jgi:polysaccharide biosynthesis protein PslJ